MRIDLITTICLYEIFMVCNFLSPFISRRKKNTAEKYPGVIIILASPSLRSPLQLLTHVDQLFNYFLMPTINVPHFRQLTLLSIRKPLFHRNRQEEFGKLRRFAMKMFFPSVFYFFLYSLRMGDSDVRYSSLPHTHAYIALYINSIWLSIISIWIIQ